MCRWTHCQHENREVDRENAVSVNGKTWYHKDCFHQKETIDKILNLYQEKIDPNPIWNQLRGVVNNIVFKNGYSADYVLFALNRYIADGKRLNYPSGLYYVVKDKHYEDAWKKKEEKKKIADISSESFTAPDPSSNTDGHIYTVKTNGFGRILR